MKNFIYLFLISTCSLFFSSCNNNIATEEEENYSYQERFSKEKIRLLYSNISYNMPSTDIDKNEILSIYRNQFPAPLSRSIETDPIMILSGDLGEENIVFIEKIMMAISMKKENYSTIEIFSIFSNDAEKKAAECIINAVEKEQILFQNIAEVASDSAQTRAKISACDVAAGIAGAIIGDIATITGVGASVGGILGISAAWGAALVGVVGGLAYTAAFC